ncbi:MAG: SOS response-associated peptidase, partial [Alphaproteobacteria bacterium]|nr:SOS response-associated peptidase [Alphaproteobacteria bacterium]
MCGRFLLVSPVELIRRAFAVAGPAPNLAARWNVAPTTACLVLRRGDDGATAFAT